MDYKEFCEHIKDEIKGFLPEQYAAYDTQLHTVSKPNVGEQVGLTFVPPVSGTPALRGEEAGQAACLAWFLIWLTGRK